MSAAREFSRRPGLPAVLSLLTAARLPTEDLTELHCEHFWFTGPPSAPEAVVGLELFGEVALLRSLVVSELLRRRGEGGRVLSHAEAEARSLGVRALYLLTTTAEQFFEKRGYQKIGRDRAPAAIRNTREFSSICPASSAFMVKLLGHST